MPLPMRVVAPKSREALFSVVSSTIQKHGNSCSLNHIDVSGVQDFSYLFEDSSFCGDISEWDVSNATSMESMFATSRFDGDISNWNVGRVKNMDHMFYGSAFKGDLSRWNVGSVEMMCGMFMQADFVGDISLWNTSKVRTMAHMFEGPRTQSLDVSKWDVSAVKDFNRMFAFVQVPLDLRAWRMAPDATITGIIASGAPLASMPGPSQLHWMQLHRAGPQGWEPKEWLEHWQLMRLAFDMDSMKPLQVGRCLQVSWETHGHLAPPQALSLPVQWLDPMVE